MEKYYKEYIKTRIDNLRKEILVQEEREKEETQRQKVETKRQKEEDERQKKED